MRIVLSLAAAFLVAIISACADDASTVNPDPSPNGPPMTGDAEAPPSKPATNEPLVLELGDVRVGEDVAFSVPAGALGFVITAEAADFDPEAPFGIERITDPNGNVVHDDFTPKGGTIPTSIAKFDAIAAASVPQGEDVPQDLAGAWRVRFGVMGSPAASLTLKGRVRVQSTGDGAFHGGRLDLHLHVPSGLEIGARTVDAANAADDADIARRIDLFFIVMRDLLQIERGDVVIHPEPGSYRELDGLDAIARGFAISAGQKDGTQALHVLLTNLIAKDGQPFAAGIAPGIPGAANVFGRNVSGIIVATSPEPLIDAATMLHEAGHFFGLSHTTELDGLGADPLSDTPACADLTAESFSHCPDRTNLMFVGGPIEGPATLSPTQQRIFRGSPIYRAAPSSVGSTMSFDPDAVRWSRTRSIAVAGTRPLSGVERELALGFCGATEIDARGLAKRHGRAQALAELQAAAADADLPPYIRGRASLALRALPPD